MKVKIPTIYILLISLLFTSFSGQVKTRYKDILISNNVIWALTYRGNIKLFDATTGNKLDKNISAGSDIILITKDPEGNPVVATEKKQVKRYDQGSNTWEIVGQYDVEPFGILVDSKGSYFLITEEGIQDLATKKLYFDKKSLNYVVTYRRNKWGKPSCFYIDKRDVIWLGFGYGEWGGNLFAFQTVEKKFLDLSLGSFAIELYPITSFCEDSSSLYIAGGIQHMGRVNGIIAKVDNLKVSILLNSHYHWSGLIRVQGEYIGPTTFNPFNNSLYFYSQNGVFCGEITKDLSKIENWEGILTHNPTGKSEDPDRGRYPITMLKICILDETRFVFLPTYSGIGFFDGEEVKML